MSHDHDHDDERTTLVELTKDIRIAMLTTMDEDGHHVSRPMARQDVDLDLDLWFITERDSRKVRHLAKNPEVSVTLSSNDSWVSLAGTARVVEDQAQLEGLWNTFTDAWMPEGPQDPNAALIKVDVRSGQYWDTPGSRVASLISFAKSRVTGEPYDGGDSGVVENL